MTDATTGPAAETVPVARAGGMAARTRWLIGGGAAIGVIVAAVAAYMFLSARPVPEALTYIPGDSAVVAELRLDLPGDQLQRFGNLLAHFPGFKDQSTLPAKIDETLNRLVGAASNGSLDYQTNLKPWISGPTFVGVAGNRSGPAGAAATPAATAAPAASGQSRAAALAFRAGTVLVASTTTGATCDQIISGAGVTKETRNGVALTIGADGLACAFDGRFGLLGLPDRIVAAIDAHRSSSGIDHSATYRAARDALGSDRIATVFASGDLQALMAAAPSLPLGAGGALQAAPEWTIGGLRAEDDALVADVLVKPRAGAAASGAVPSGAASSPVASLLSLPPAHASQLVSFLPGDALGLVEVHGAGVALQNALTALSSDPDLSGQAAQLQGALALAGGGAGLVGWVDDAGIVILPAAATAGSGAPVGPAGLPIDGGVVLAAADDAGAQTHGSQLKSLLGLAALSGGGRVDESTVDGTTITTVDLGNIGSLLGAGGAGGGGATGGLPIPSDLHLTVSMAVRGKLVMFGGGEGFVRRLLEVQAGSTLADATAYRHAVARATDKSAGFVFVSGGAVRDLAQRFLPADMQQRWQSDILPYAQPFEGVLATTTFEGDLSHSRFIVTVATPTQPSGTPAQPGATP